MFRSLTILYRGFSGEKQPDGSIKYGDAYFTDLPHFMEEIDRLAQARYNAMQKGMERAEKLLEDRRNTEKLLK